MKNFLMEIFNILILEIGSQNDIGSKNDHTDHVQGDSILDFNPEKSQSRRQIISKISTNQ